MQFVEHRELKECCDYTNRLRSSVSARYDRGANEHNRRRDELGRSSPDVPSTAHRRRPVISGARGGEHSAVEWRLVQRRPSSMIRPRIGVGTTPPNVEGAAADRMSLVIIASITYLQSGRPDQAEMRPDIWRAVPGLRGRNDGSGHKATD
jgi:hypothetical protein